MADERAVIAKESAFIRTSFKSENAETRYINVQKLLYIFMLGYPAHFGQMECLKLVASPKFMDKRLGYLGIMLLLDENQELLTLVTNSLKNDMNNSNVQIVGLALCTLGNISSPEMARDLSTEVEKLIESSNSYVRKKAALTAIRLIHKVPDLLENFQTKAIKLLNEKHHGVLLTAVSLLIEMCKMDPNVVELLRKSSVPTLVRHLKNFTTPGYSPEHDVSGITDPFLQVKILRLLRFLGNGSTTASDAMNDILAQVATNTDGSKNVGNAILYETVLTIMEIESENSLRVLAINILGKFLSNKDNNIRYVALTTLTKTSQTALSADNSALQRHRATILDCLRDPDVSIRHRALDLSFFLINSQNIRILTRELLSFLEVAEADIKTSVASRIVDFAGRFRPNKRWEVDTSIRVMRAAGANVDPLVINHCVKILSTATRDLQLYATRKLVALLRTEGDSALAQEGLVIVTVWCVGEFGDLLARGAGVDGLSFGDEDDGIVSPTTSAVADITERDIVEFLKMILEGPFATSLVKEYIITCLVKLTGRVLDEAVLAIICSLLAKFQTHADVEIQTRAVEFTAVTKLDADTRMALLESMPVLESALKEEERKGFGEPTQVTASRGVKERDTTASGNILDLGNDLVNLGSAPSSSAAGPAAGSDLLDLMFGGTASTPVSNSAASGLDSVFAGLSRNAAPSQNAGVAAKNDIMDLFGGLSYGSSSTFTPAKVPQFSGFPTPAQTITPQQQQKPSSAQVDLLGDLFGPASTTTSQATAMFGTMQNLSTSPAVSVPPTDLNSFRSPPKSTAISASTVSDPFAMLAPAVSTGFAAFSGGGTTASVGAKTVTCYEKNSLRISLTSDVVEQNGNIQITATFANTGLVGSISGLSFQVAVPKSLKLHMQSPSSTVVAPGAFAIQKMRVENPTKAAIKLRIKVAYVGASGSVEDIVEFAGL
ncbi:clathrin associated protein complex large subunit [Entophlyctis luteolus]|nr:clathrin associated protein complex large subunit [Entophlyctis luteolus]